MLEGKVYLSEPMAERLLHRSVGRGGDSSAFSAAPDSPLGFVFASMAGIVSLPALLRL